MGFYRDTGVVLRLQKLGEADRAEAAMRLHLREILTSLPELAERFPDFFDRDAAVPLPGPHMS